MSQESEFHPTEVKVHLPEVSSMVVLDGNCEGGKVYDPQSPVASEKGLNIIVKTADIYFEC